MRTPAHLGARPGARQAHACSDRGVSTHPLPPAALFASRHERRLIPTAVAWATMDLTEHELKPLYNWIDQIPLSRPKRNIARDFSDGVLVAEVIAHFYPKLVELHNYSSANAMTQKVYNWQTLNTRALKKLGFQIPRVDFMDVANGRAGAIERVLKMCKFKMAEFQSTHGVAGNGGGTVATRDANGTGGGGGGVASPGDGNHGMHGRNGQNQVNYIQSPAAAVDESGTHNDHAQVPPIGVVVCSACGHANHVGNNDPTETHREYGGRGQHGGGILKATSSDFFERNENGGDATDAVLKRKDALVAELRETNTILDAKSRKLEQLVRLKDAKIQTLLNKLQALGALRPE